MDDRNTKLAMAASLLKKLKLETSELISTENRAHYIERVLQVSKETDEVLDSILGLSINLKYQTWSETFINDCNQEIYIEYIKQYLLEVCIETLLL